MLKDEQVQRVMAHHTSPQEAGTVFTRAHPKLAVYTHLMLPARPSFPPSRLTSLSLKHEKPTPALWKSAKTS